MPVPPLFSRGQGYVREDIGAGHFVRRLRHTDDVGCVGSRLSYTVWTGLGCVGNNLSYVLQTGVGFVRERLV